MKCKENIVPEDTPNRINYKSIHEYLLWTQLYYLFSQLFNNLSPFFAMDLFVFYYFLEYQYEEVINIHKALLKQIY